MLATTKQALDHRLATEQRDRRVPSLVAAVVRDGVPLWSGGRGKVDGATPTEDTQYRIGSITKTFVGVMIMRLRDEGMLSLSDPLRTHPVTHIDNSCVGCGNCGEVADAAVLCPSFYRGDIVQNPNWFDRALHRVRQRTIGFLQRLVDPRDAAPVAAE